MTIETILAILTLLLGGCNVFQLIWWRAEKQKHQAEADSISVDVDQKRQDMQQDKYDYLMSKIAKFQSDYLEISELLKQESRKHIDEITELDKKYQALIDEKCDEMAVIKSELIYFKGIRCYRADCPHRIKDNPDSGSKTKKQRTPHCPI